MDKTNYRQTEYNKPFIIQRQILMFTDIPMEPIGLLHLYRNMTVLYFAKAIRSTDWHRQKK